MIRTWVRGPNMIIVKSCRYCGKRFELEVPHKPAASMHQFCSTECRFFDKVDVNWQWIAGKNESGYGRFVVTPGHKVYAHVWCWEFYNGRKVRPGYFILHKTDDPGCVNPDLLYEGTHLDNMRDMRVKGRAHRPKSISRILTGAKVLEIRRLFEKEGYTRTRLGKMFGVSRTTVAYLIARKTWKAV